MNKEIRVLVVEDSEDDTMLIIREIKSSGYEPIFKRVENAIDMRNALSENKWDVVIVDYSMPHFSGLEALKLLKEEGLDLPFIIVSGTIWEDTAVEAMKAGAHDYIKRTLNCG